MSERRQPDGSLAMLFGSVWYAVYVVTDLIAVLVRESAAPAGTLNVVYVVAMSVLKWLLVAPLAWVVTAAAIAVAVTLWPQRRDAARARAAVVSGSLAVAVFWLLLGFAFNTGWLDWDHGSQTVPPGLVGSVLHGIPYFAACLGAALIVGRAAVKHEKR
jgi:hypothetical protein